MVKEEDGIEIYVIVFTYSKFICFFLRMPTHKKYRFLQETFLCSLA